MTEHTPGPWTRGADPFLVWADKGYHIATVTQIVTDGDYIGDANAELIAAAPETAAERDRLREALDFLLSASEHAGIPDTACDNKEVERDLELENALEAAQIQARAALAREEVKNDGHASVTAAVRASRAMDEAGLFDEQQHPDIVGMVAGIIDREFRKYTS